MMFVVSILDCNTMAVVIGRRQKTLDCILFQNLIELIANFISGLFHTVQVIYGQVDDLNPNSVRNSHLWAP